MRVHILSLVIACLVAAPAAAEEAAKERRHEGLIDIVEVENLRPDDWWATVRLQIDAKGRPTDCTVLRSNLRRPEQRWRACYAMMQNWRGDPIIEDGKPVAGSVVRTYIVPGTTTRREIGRAERERRARERAERER